MGSLVGRPLPSPRLAIEWTQVILKLEKSDPMAKGTGSLFGIQQWAKERALTELEAVWLPEGHLLWLGLCKMDINTSHCHLTEGLRGQKRCENGL